MKKILMVSAQYLPEVYGGAEQQCQKLSKRLISKGHKVTILTSRSSFRDDRILNIAGVRIVRLYCSSPPQLLGRRSLSSFVWLFQSTVWSIINRKSFDVVHVHQAKFQAFVGTLISKLLRKKCIVKAGNAGTHFDLLSLEKKKGIGKQLSQYVIKNGDLFVAISDEISENYQSFGINQSRIFKTTNFVEQNISFDAIQKIREGMRKELKLNSSAKNILFCGRLEPQKNILTLVDSIHLAIENGYQVELYIAGAGSLEKETIQKIETLRLTKYVHLLGYIDNTEHYYIACDFFLLPSISEGMSNALLEAMSYGCIPIASKVSGTVDILGACNSSVLMNRIDKEGILESLLLAIDNKLDDANHRSKIYNIVRENYSFDVGSKTYTNLYESI